MPELATFSHGGEEGSHRTEEKNIYFLIKETIFLFPALNRWSL